jgi:thioredoxin-like negative regulator of GroEL
MRKNLHFVLVLGGVMILSFISACSQEQTPIRRSGDGGAARPSAINMDRLAAQAKDQGKSVYMEFTAPWCHYCKKFQNEVLSTAQSQQALKKVIFVRANFDREKPLARQFGVKAIPTGLLLKPRNGQLQAVDRHVGGLSQSEFVRFLSR